MRSGVNGLRIGRRNEGPASQPPTAARSGGKKSKIASMRIRRRIRTYYRVRESLRPSSTDDVVRAHSGKLRGCEPRIRYSAFLQGCSWTTFSIFNFAQITAGARNLTNSG